LKSLGNAQKLQKSLKSLKILMSDIYNVYIGGREGGREGGGERERERERGRGGTEREEGRGGGKREREQFERFAKQICLQSCQDD
jgi:hypothetical protein